MSVKNYDNMDNFYCTTSQILAAISRIKHSINSIDFKQFNMYWTI